MKPVIPATILPLIAAFACLITGCQQTSPSPPEQKAPLVLDGRIVGKWVETGHGGDLEIKSDGTGTMKDKSGATASFTWATEGEKLTISRLSAPSSIWPPKDGSYGYLYSASEQIRGAAFFEVTTEDGKTSWSMDRP